MDTQKIVLPDFLIADLYKSCLVDIHNFSPDKKKIAEDVLPTDVKPQKASDDKIKYVGENRKNVIIVINQAGAVDLNKQDLTFLTNILKACQLDMADIAIVNAATQEVTYAAIKEQLHALQIILFDAEPSFIKLPFKIPPFQIQTYGDTAILVAPALSALNKSDQEGRLLKTKLWNSLKQVFGV
jgi:hypothetical protein